MTTSDNECQRVTIPANFPFFFFQIKEEPTTKHPKENFLNLEEDLWRRPIELRAETSTQKEILTVRSRNCRSSCSQIFTKMVFLKILQYSLLIDFRASRPATFLTLKAPISQNGQTHSDNSSANCRRIVWVRLTIL